MHIQRRLTAEPDAVDPGAWSYLEAQPKPPTASVAEIWARHQHLASWLVVEKAAADTWEELPKAFDAESKNPCWTDAAGVFKCLPYFQILGVSKCGTTDLYHRLVAHPDFVEAPWKGPHFWDESNWPRPKGPDPAKYDGTFPAYVRIFDKPAKAIAQDKARRITGEASSNTFTGVAAYLRGSTLSKRINATLAEYMWEAAPWSRFVVVFRDPVTRYYSAYYYYRSKARGAGTAEEFHKVAVNDIATWRRCVGRGGEHQCLKAYNPQQLVKGLYAAFIPYWRDVWPSDQLLFLRTEDYKAASVEHVRAVADFLGLRRLNSSWLEGAKKMKKRNTRKYPDMLDETRRLLQDFYRPYNQRLVELMDGDKRWTWGY